MSTTHCSRHPNASSPHKRFLVGCSSRASSDSPNTARGLSLGASDAFLVGENPTCSVLAWYGFEGLWPYDYGHA